MEETEYEGRPTEVCVVDKSLDANDSCALTDDIEMASLDDEDVAKKDEISPGSSRETN